ncbi:transglutaminase family protein [Uliginosibacterium flavum]|uniref:Transglutaminase family protein n=1 Tax=Uliginosibacterium flavum TaxID=1396831 RepID=A0ABV2TKU7_9RHOO
MKYTIRHETRCHFDSPASFSIRNLRITPREEAGLRIENWRVSTPGRSSCSLDTWGNTTHLLTLTEPHENVRILVTGVVDVPDEAVSHFGQGDSPLAPQIYLASTQLTSVDAALAKFSHQHLKQPPQSIDMVLAMLEVLREELLPMPSGGEALRGAAASFGRGRATLPDQVHVLIAACRAAGLPARFVSGYQLGDASHKRASEYAWADVWLEAEGGWVSVDARRAQLASGRQVRLAVGRDYLDACPMRSIHQGGGHEEVRVSVQAA